MSISNLFKSETASYLDLQVDSINAQQYNPIIVYNPILTPQVNIASASLHFSNAEQVNNRVLCKVYGSVQTSSSASGVFDLTLPVGRTTPFPDDYQVCGAGSKFNIGSGTGSGLSIQSITGATAQIRVFIHPSTITDDNFELIFSYEII